eukprot:Hpha_TRINITY_DN12771_c0_g1::TRINITY_DN12771_c0_g1_i1::g.114254::m.114254
MHCARTLGRAVRPAFVRVVPRGIVSAPARQQRELSRSIPSFFPGRRSDNDDDDDGRPPRRDDRRRDYEDRPSRRRHDDHEDERPQRRRRYDDEEDDRRPARRERGEERDDRDDRRRSDYGDRERGSRERGDRDREPRRGDRERGEDRPPRREREEPPPRRAAEEEADEASAPVREETKAEPAAAESAGKPEIQLMLRWEVYPDHDAYTGDNVEVWVDEGCQYGDHEKGDNTMVKKGWTTNEARAHCEKKNYGGFVVWRKNAYFRRRRPDQIADRKYKANEVEMHVGFKN